MIRPGKKTYHLPYGYERSGSVVSIANSTTGQRFAKSLFHKIFHKTMPTSVGMVLFLCHYGTERTGNELYRTLNPGNAADASGGWL
jgi:hypothetical protein